MNHRPVTRVVPMADLRGSRVHVAMSAPLPDVQSGANVVSAAFPATIDVSDGGVRQRLGHPGHMWRAKRSPAAGHGRTGSFGDSAQRSKVAAYSFANVPAYAPTVPAGFGATFGHGGRPADAESAEMFLKGVAAPAVPDVDEGCEEARRVGASAPHPTSLWGQLESTHAPFVSAQLSHFA